MRIRNFKQLATSPASRAALRILEAGLDAINPEKALRALVKVHGNTLIVGGKRFPLKGKLYVVGAGKASGVMASVLEKILGNRIAQGLVIDVTARTLKRITVVKGDHPVLSERNVRTTLNIKRLADEAGIDDIVLCLISGGGSALLADPWVSLKDYQNLMHKLLRSGADIHELNTVRKHIDSIKGGRLAMHCFPATVISLLVSDVPGNDPAFIASGPTVRDTTTNRDAIRILKKYRIKDGAAAETPKDARFFRNVHNVMALDNTKAVNAMAAEARNMGLRPRIVSTKIAGEARETGVKLLNKLTGKKSVVIAAGETTVTVTGHGKGGRNQEVVLGALHLLSRMPGCALASMGTDGIDNTPAAGAIADDKTLALERKKGLRCTRALENNDSYPFFKKLGKLIITGPTGTNVSDVMVAVRF
ncbi:MAG TPA: DUF4147 domain-containing protein [Candidatus Binatia bacterium]|nr:DUF4147 domain-containing protein [Candidatus Binatia bacterium]